MKTRSILKERLHIIYLGGVVTCLSLIILSCTVQKSDKTAQQAFELRLMGNADSAKVLLEQIIAEDSLNAMAWYELARTKHHIGLGDPQQFFGSLEDLQQTIEAAVDDDAGNVIYSFYKGYVCFIRAYASLMMGQPDVKEKVADAVSAYEAVLNLKPDYHEVKLYLVEILGLSEEMGGDSAKAEAYAQQLEEMDAVYGAKARELRLPDDTDRVAYWQEVVGSNPDNADALEQLGKAYLYQDSSETGTKYLEEAMKADPGRELLMLDLVRYYSMAGMQDTLKKDIMLPLAEEFIQKYLATEPISPLKAFSYELSAKIKFGLSDNEGASELREKAKAIDPNFSKAFGVPPSLLFTKPDEISRQHTYFFRPL